MTTSVELGIYKDKEVLAARKAVDDANRIYLDTINNKTKACKHTHVVSKKTYYGSGYDYVSETDRWEECTYCGTKTTSVTTTYGTTYS